MSRKSNREFARFLRDAETLAECVAATIERLHALGLGHLAADLERGLSQFAGD
jgi:hypothetical protein